MRPIRAKGDGWSLADWRAECAGSEVGAVAADVVKDVLLSVAGPRSEVAVGEMAESFEGGLSAGEIEGGEASEHPDIQGESVLASIGE